MRRCLLGTLFVPLLFACSKGGPPSGPSRPRIEEQVTFTANPAALSTPSSWGQVPTVVYYAPYQIINHGGPVAHTVTLTPIGPGGELYEDVEGRTTASRTLYGGMVSEGARVTDYNTVRARAVRYRLRLDVTFPDGTTGSLERESIVIDSLPPRPAGLVISEVRASGPAGTVDQFVELHNRSDVSVTLDRSWHLEAWAPSGEIMTLYSSFDMTVPSGCHVLLATEQRPSVDGVQRDGTIHPFVPVDGGIALRGLSYQVIDQVGFNVNSVFKEGLPLAPLTGNRNRSYVRVRDTADNASDFVVAEPSQPENLRHCGR